MRMLRLTLLLAPLLATSGCFGAIAGLDSYTFGGDAGFDGGGGPVDLTWKFNAFTPHAMPASPQVVESTIVDGEGNVAAVIVYDPFPPGRAMNEVTGRLAATLDPTNTYQGRTWADIDMNRIDTPDAIHGGSNMHTDGLPPDLGSDHSWVDPIGPDGLLDIEHPDALNNHDSNRMDATDRGDVTFTAMNILTHLHTVIVLTLQDTSGENTVGFYRFKIEMGMVPLGFHDLAIAGHAYTLSAFIDLNDNDTQDPMEVSASMNATAGAAGTNVAFTFDVNNFH